MGKCFFSWNLKGLSENGEGKKEKHTQNENDFLIVFRRRDFELDRNRKRITFNDISEQNHAPNLQVKTNNKSNFLSNL